MKAILLILLVMLVLLVALPYAMAMEMDGCPACSAIERASASMCMAILMFALFSVRFAHSRLTLALVRSSDPPILSSLFRPPRAV